MKTEAAIAHVHMAGMSLGAASALVRRPICRKRFEAIVTTTALTAWTPFACGPLQSRALSAWTPFACGFRGRFHSFWMVFQKCSLLRRTPFMSRFASFWVVLSKTTAAIRVFVESVLQLWTMADEKDIAY